MKTLYTLVWLLVASLSTGTLVAQNTVEVGGNLKVDSLKGQSERYIGVDTAGFLIPLEIPYANVLYDSSRLVLTDSLGDIRFILDANDGSLAFYDGDTTYSMYWGNSFDMFLNIDGEPITGESRDASRGGEIDVLSWSWGVSQSGTLHTLGGGGSGRVEFNVDSLSKNTKLEAGSDSTAGNVSFTFVPDSLRIDVDGELNAFDGIVSDRFSTRPLESLNVSLVLPGESIENGVGISARDPSVGATVGIGFVPRVHLIEIGGNIALEGDTITFTGLEKKPKIKRNNGSILIEADTVKAESGPLMADTLVVGPGLGEFGEGVIRFTGGAQILTDTASQDYGSVRIVADTTEVAGIIRSEGYYSTQKGLRSIDPELRLSVTGTGGAEHVGLTLDTSTLVVGGALSVLGGLDAIADTLRIGTATNHGKVTFDLPSGPFLRVQGTTRLDIEGVRLRGDFEFDRTSSDDPGLFRVSGQTDSSSLILYSSGLLKLESRPGGNSWLFDYERGSDTLVNHGTGFRWISVRDSDADPGNTVLVFEDDEGNGNNTNWDFGGEDTVEGRISTNDGLHSVLVKLALAERNVGLHSVERLGIHNGQLSFQGSLDSIETSASLLAIDHVGHDTSMLVLYPGVGWELRGNRGRLRHDEFYFSDYEYDPLNRLCKLEYLSLEPGFKDTLGLRYDFMAGAITTDDPLHADGGLYVGGPSSIEAEGPLHIGTTSGGNAVGREHDPMGLRLSDEAENWELHGSGTVNAHVALSPDRVSWAAEDESGGTSFAIDMIPGLSTMEVHGSAEVFGNVNVLGELTAGIKLFRIDHPLDPENKYLQHSCVEGPERINVYNGTVVTDEKGFAEVQMPDYFMALNRDFEYQLTVIGRTFARAVVWEEMSEQGTFLIRSEEPDLKVSWMVTGIRNDELARQNPFEVEVAKN